MSSASLKKPGADIPWQEEEKVKKNNQSEGKTTSQEITRRARVFARRVAASRVLFK